MENIHDIINDKIKHGIPYGSKPVTYLMDLFGIGVDSAYRRLKGQIPYTFSEMVKLSINLGFSIDEIIGNNEEENVYFELFGNNQSSLHESLIDTFEKYYNLFANHHHAKKTELIITLNSIPMVLVLRYDFLFKFFYFKLLHQLNEVPLNYKYTDVLIPSDVIALCDKIKPYYMTSNRQYFVMDSQIVLNTIEQIQYYYKRDLISEEDIQLIKKDLNNYIDYIGGVAHSGVNYAGSSVDIYISTVNIATNTIYSSYDENIESLFFFHPIPISTTDTKMCSMHLDWLETIRKYTILISNSNEILQMEVFDMMKKSIDTIDNNNRLSFV